MAALFGQRAGQEQQTTRFFWIDLQHLPGPGCSQVEAFCRKGDSSGKHQRFGIIWVDRNGVFERILGFDGVACLVEGLAK